jgi:hypothetical protein
MPGPYAARVAIGAYNCYVITREDLHPALLALVLAGALSHDVIMAINTPDDPRSIQTCPGGTWSSHDETNRSSCPDQGRHELSSRLVHTVFSFLLRYCCVRLTSAFEA